VHVEVSEAGPDGELHTAGVQVRGELLAGAIAGVAAVAPGRVVSVIAQMLGHLRLERGLKHRLGQPRQKPARADELDPLGAGGFHELLGELLLINTIRHSLDRLGHDKSFPRAALGVSDQLHR